MDMIVGIGLLRVDGKLFQARDFLLCCAGVIGCGSAICITAEFHQRSKVQYLIVLALPHWMRPKLTLWINPMREFLLGDASLEV